ncbi:MAG: hypothetical protein JZU47_04070 [Prolixibacteraceae bacterium]|nr:hypothetical protein [Prolixibacteraceae bacterium]
MIRIITGIFLILLGLWFKFYLGDDIFSEVPKAQILFYVILGRGIYDFVKGIIQISQTKEASEDETVK